MVGGGVSRVQARSGRAVVVGDSLRTGMLAGFQAGLGAILVLWGVSAL
ncbi:HAD hydrolase-like protein, partial [Klebsiella pneumoniae]